MCNIEIKLKLLKFKLHLIKNYFKFYCNVWFYSLETNFLKITVKSFNFQLILPLVWKLTLCDFKKVLYQRCLINLDLVQWICWKEVSTLYQNLFSYWEEFQKPLKILKCTKNLKDFNRFSKILGDHSSDLLGTLLFRCLMLDIVKILEKFFDKHHSVCYGETYTLANLFRWKSQLISLSLYQTFAERQTETRKWT